MRLWDTETGEQKAIFTMEEEQVGIFSMPVITITSVAISPDGKTLAIGNMRDTVQLWDIETGEQKAILTGHTDRVWTFAFSPDGKTLASGGWDGTVLVWKVD